MPVIQEVYEKYKGQIEVISVTKEDPDHPDGLPKSREFVAENGLGWLFCEDQHVVRSYDFTRIPYTLFINEYGFIFHAQDGFADAETIEFQVRRMLGLPALGEPVGEPETEPADQPATG